jgi:hypothetical protein
VSRDRTIPRAVIGVALAVAAACTAPPRGPVRWQKVVVDPAFRAEACAAADVDGDGDLDLFAGDAWYEAPAWRRHAIRAARDFGDGRDGYSETFACFADDVDRDGRCDQIVVGMPGTAAAWYRNPGAAGEWSRHEIHARACNESPAYTDLFDDGRRVLLIGDGERLVWCEPGADPRAPWTVHAISEAGCPAAVQFAHGLGVGDVDGDGRTDVVTAYGYWLQPADARTAPPTTPWSETRVRVAFDCAQMYVGDADRDGRNDVFSSSAHGRGVDWNRLRVDGDGLAFLNPWRIVEHVSQTHALACADLDGDGERDLVTGKRWWAHGPNGDVDPAGTPWLFWIRVVPGSPPRFELHAIDAACGVGTQIEIADFDADGRADVAVANKLGVHLLLQRDGNAASR